MKDNSILGRIARAPVVRAGLIAAALTLGASAGVGLAQSRPALTATSIALTAEELGPDWSVVSQHSANVEGNDLRVASFASPSGRKVQIFSVVADSTGSAESMLVYIQGQLQESSGATVSSVQTNGFGDGRAFKAEYGDGHITGISYSFRAQNLAALVTYVGASASADLEAQAVAVSRKQEKKLFALLAPAPVPSATAIPAVAATPAPAPALITQPTPSPSPAPVAAAAEPASAYCAPGDKPQFRFGFATLSARLGDQMGSPTSCEYGDPRGSGDTLQDTARGLSFYRQQTNTPTFTNGTDHWAITGSGMVHWTGDSIDPPQDALALKQ